MLSAIGSVDFIVCKILIINNTLQIRDIRLIRLHYIFLECPTSYLDSFIACLTVAYQLGNHRVVTV